jgi:hypothetical protein
MEAVYPMVASRMPATTSDDDGLEDADTSTFWLTYWALFNILFLAMDYLVEDYSVWLAVAIYLFLALFFKEPT